MSLTLGLLDLRQIHGRIISEPDVSGPEALGLGRLGVPHDAENVGDVMLDTAYI